MKIGLDYHGVITANPKLFSRLSSDWVKLNYEVHIITGSRITDSLLESLVSNQISYTHLFSISDYHYQLGTQMTGYAEGEPCISENIWDMTKAVYCELYSIDMHIDDSPVYGHYFKTPYLMYKG